MPTELLALLSSAGLAIGAGLRWALRLWAEVRREQIVADKLAAERAIEAQKSVSAQASRDHQRMVEALVDQARSMAELGGQIHALATKLDTLVEWRERTPVEGYPRIEASELDGERPPSRPGHRAVRTAPYGYRPPKAGDHND